mmetsp:Transcript_51491/g.95250  ORF Transcript_51491/g.95250 Transcript_51491/m.95250 type:complete len:183 (+) Transcript_51491:111-659(+)
MNSSRSELQSNLQRRKEELDARVAAADARANRRHTKCEDQCWASKSLADCLASLDPECMEGLGSTASRCLSTESWKRCRKSKRDCPEEPSESYNFASVLTEKLLEAKLAEVAEVLESIKAERGANLSLNTYAHFAAELESLTADALELACMQQQSTAILLVAKTGDLLQDLGCLWSSRRLSR